MIFKRNLVGFISLLVLVVVLGYFFLPREQHEPTPQTELEISAPPVKGKAPIEIAGFEPMQDRIGKAEYEEEESIEDLERRAFGHPEPEERIGAVLELSQREDGKQSLATLVAILHTDKEEDVRDVALDALDELQGLSFDVVAKVALNDPEPSLRMRAVEILGEMDKGDKRIADLLKRIASADRDEEVKEAAKELLEEAEN